MRVDPTQVAPLHAAIQDHFTPLDLDRLLIERCNIHLHVISSQMKAFEHQVVDVVRHFQTRNTAEELVTALRDARPRVQELVRLADDLGYTQLPAGGFEVLINAQGPAYSDPAEFRTRLSKLEDAICRVETPQAYGTGVLIAPNRVITNFHVIEKAVSDGRLVQPSICLFGHRRAGPGTTPAKRFGVKRLLAWSPPSNDDLLSDCWNSDVDRLDYAVLELTEAAGNLPLVDGGEARGSVALSAGAMAAENDALLILQHPQGQPLKIDLGSVTAVRSTRLRYNVNTEPGSSGAPVFNRLLELVAIHHVGIDWPAAHMPYNQGIPVDVIRSHAAQRDLNL